MGGILKNANNPSALSKVNRFHVPTDESKLTFLINISYSHVLRFHNSLSHYHGFPLICVFSLWVCANWKNCTYLQVFSLLKSFFEHSIFIPFCVYSQLLGGHQLELWF